MFFKKTGLHFLQAGYIHSGNKLDFQHYLILGVVRGGTE